MSRGCKFILVYSDIKWYTYYPLISTIPPSHPPKKAVETFCIRKAVLGQDGRKPPLAFLIAPGRWFLL